MLITLWFSYSYGGTYLTTNYTIDFFKNVKTQICYSNEDCPHYSSCCFISDKMFKNKGIKSDSYDSKTLNFTKEYLTKNNIYGICYYQYYCTENINNTTPNNKCIVIESSEEKVEPSSYKNEGDIDLGSFNLKEGFYKSNITKVYHCNEDSIENKYCPKFYDNSCKENMDCLS